MPLQHPPPEDGAEPDYRFSLANERTFLAWIRTALALLAGAVAVVFVPNFRGGDARWLLGIGLAVVSMVTAAYAHRRWAANERAIRAGRPLSASPATLGLSVAIGVVAITVIVFAIIDAAS